jgi:hypothetical protein
MPRGTLPSDRAKTLPLPMIEPEDVALICWMAVEAAEKDS